MTTTSRILAINGSYRTDGITDQAVAAASEALREAGAEVETVWLREPNIAFCTNCRACMQAPGDEPGECVHGDAMRKLVAKIEAADGFILAAPTNVGSVTALFKRFMERLGGYAYWPWGMPAPKMRKAHAPKKRALLISSCAAPGILGRWVYSSRRQLRETAKIIGARPVGTVFTGLIAGSRDSQLPGRARKRTAALARRLTRAGN